MLCPRARKTHKGSQETGWEQGPEAGLKIAPEWQKDLFVCCTVVVRFACDLAGGLSHISSTDQCVVNQRRKGKESEAGRASSTILGQWCALWSSHALTTGIQHISEQHNNNNAIKLMSPHLCSVLSCCPAQH